MTKGRARGARAVLLSTCTVLAVLSLAATADAASAPGHFRGVVTAQTTGGQHFARPSVSAGLAGSNNLFYFGGPVMHSDANYSLYWEPSGHTSSASYKNIIDGYFSNVATASGSSGNDYSVATQYYDGQGPIAYQASFGGRLLDTHAYPASGCPEVGGEPCLTDNQLIAELNSTISSQGLPRGLGTVYYIFTPPGVITCFDNTGSDCSAGATPANFTYCAYHSSFGKGTSSTLYAVLPYGAVDGCDSYMRPNGDDADATLDDVSHENIEAITDPLGNAWYDNSGDEIADKCAYVYGSSLGGSGTAQYNEQIGTGNYYLQEEWSNASSSCVQRMAGGTVGSPTAAFTYSPTSPATGQTVTFNGSSSTDTGANITSYAWNFGDGKTSTGVSAPHAYTQAGTYTVSLKVTDSSGQTSTAIKTVAVAAVGPTAAFTFSPAAPTAGQTVTFNGSGSTDTGSTIRSYAWTFGDGRTGSGVSINHAYSAPGTYTVTLKVIDGASRSSTTTQTVTVSRGSTSGAPTAAFTFSPSSPAPRQRVSFNGSGSSSPSGSIVRWAWTFGDGGSATGVSVNHVFRAGGTYTVTLMVTDRSGNTASVSKAVVVAGRAGRRQHHRR